MTYDHYHKRNVQKANLAGVSSNAMRQVGYAL